MMQNRSYEGKKRKTDLHVIHEGRISPQPINSGPVEIDYSNLHAIIALEKDILWPQVSVNKRVFFPLFFKKLLENFFVLVGTQDFQGVFTVLKKLHDDDVKTSTSVLGKVADLWGKIVLRGPSMGIETIVLTKLDNLQHKGTMSQREFRRHKYNYLQLFPCSRYPKTPFRFFFHETAIHPT
jgi:hypothetical protein